MINYYFCDFCGRNREKDTGGIITFGDTMESGCSNIPACTERQKTEFFIKLKKQRQEIQEEYERQLNITIQEEKRYLFGMSRIDKNKGGKKDENTEQIIK